MLCLNGFSIQLAGPAFDVLKAQMEPTNVKAARESLGEQWVSLYHEGSLYSLAKSESAMNGLGVPTKLVLADHIGFRFASALLADELKNVFTGYEPERARPFTFVAQKLDVVAEAAKVLRYKPDLLSKFEIRPKYELEPKLIELRDGELEVALIVSLTTRWICNAEVRELIDAGITVKGLHVINKEIEPGERRLVGRIDRLQGDRLYLLESFNNENEVVASDVRIEGSRESFATCLKHVLAKRYVDFSKAVDSELGKLRGGDGLDSELRKMHAFLKKKSPIILPGGVQAVVGDQVRIANQDGYKTIVTLSPSKYCFDRARTKFSDYAWVGLSRFGPFDRESFPKRSPRILVICPDSVAGKVSQSLKLFRDGITTLSNSRYDGFTDTFHLTNPELINLSVELFGIPSSDVAKLYRSKIEGALARDSRYDAAFNIVLDEHSSLPDPSNPYLVAKSILLSNGIPVQEARVSTLTSSTPQQQQHIFQNIATALYAKMGGVPWTVDHGETVDDELVIGIGSVELSGSRYEKRQRHVGITTVFRGDGNYLLSSLSRECHYDEYPDVLRESTVRVLRDIKNRNNWQPGETVRIVFHAYKPLKNVEVADIIAASVSEVGGEQNIEFAFLTVSLDHSFTLIDRAQPGIKNYNGSIKGMFAPQRGLIIQVGQYTRLVTTTSPNMIKRPNLPLPNPLLVHLHKNSTYRDLTYLSEQVLKFTTLSWRSTLPTEKPVTILYSALIADLLGRLRTVEDWSPAVLNTKLKTSKWFL